MGDKRIYSNNKVFNVSYHIVWIPKYRKRILNGNLGTTGDTYLDEVKIIDKIIKKAISFNCFRLSELKYHVVDS